MRIDNSKFEAFTKNPERYRLIYEIDPTPEDPDQPRLQGWDTPTISGAAPRVTPTPLLDGSIFHLVMEGHNRGWSKAELQERVKLQNITERAAAPGLALGQHFLNRYKNDDRFKLRQTENGEPFAEQEFLIQIPGSPHFIMGKIDEYIDYEGEPWIGDYKSANAKATENRKRIEFEFSSQPLFYLNAARLLGLPAKGMLYRVITKHTPPQFFIIGVKRSENRLDTALMAIHQVCETIEFYKRTFGVNNPWPHNYYHYPCNYSDMAGNPTCEYATICQRPTNELEAGDLEQFKPRVSHLEIDK